MDATHVLRARAEEVLQALSDARPRLRGLASVSIHEHEFAESLLAELGFFSLTARTGGGSSARDLSKAAKLFANGAEAQLYLLVTALLSVKLATDSKHKMTSAERLIEELDAMTFDVARPKNSTLALLRALKSEVEERISFVRTARAKRFRFSKPPELYKDRKNKRERPDSFFVRVYGNELPHGLTQADIRAHDPAFYNVFHVWCARNGKRLSRYVPPARFKPRPG